MYLWLLSGTLPEAPASIVQLPSKGVFLEMTGFVKCLWAPRWSQTDLGCSGVSGTTSGKEL